MAQLEIAPNFGLSGFRRALAIGGAAFVLTLFFLLNGFPYDRLAPRVANSLATLTGAQVTIGGLELGMVWLTPQLRARQLTFTWPDGKPFVFDRVRIHPVVSTAWFRGRPALQVALRSPLGEADGVVVVGPEPSFDGEVRDLALALLPLEDVAAGTVLDGRADATIDLQMAEAGPQGTLDLAAKDGSLTLPMLPIGIPFDTLGADLEFGGDVLAKLASLDLVGPLASLTASGTVGQAPTPLLAPLAVQARIEAREPALRTMLQSQGLPLDASGGATLAIDGTLGAPNIAPSRAPGRSR